MTLNKSILFEDNTMGLVCTSDAYCKVCSLVTPDLEIGPSPSKILKVTDVSSLSPRDKLDPKKKKSTHPPNAGLVSTRIDFMKGHREPSGQVEFQQPESIKIYTETKRSRSFKIQQCVEKDQARLLMCQLCRHFSSVPIISRVNL